jgi:hypothetical protein
MAGRFRISLKDRFLEKVKKGDGCWEWIGSKNSKGYGTLRRAGGHWMAHRVSYELAHGCKLPPNRWVLHRCDNPICVNPDHLFLGTQSDNMRDMARKERGCSKLSHTQAYEILWRKASGERRRALADEYGVSFAAVKDLVRRKTWQSLSSLDHD